MKLKIIKPNLNSSIAFKNNKNILLNTSFTSLNSSRSSINK